MSTESKSPRTVEVKMLVPYSIIVAIAVIGFSFIAGFHTSQRYEDQVKHDAQVMVTSLASKKAQ